MNNTEAFAILKKQEETDYTILLFVSVTGVISFSLYFYPLIRTVLAGVF